VAPLVVREIPSAVANLGVSQVNPALIIARKRDGGRLPDVEFTEFVSGYARGEIADYQMAALAMAIYLRGLDAGETATLTRAMLESGTTLRWSASGPPRVDKHSTGGIGDKVSLVLAPLLACCGLWVPMISGRGLGPTGGTLDKLESIPGFRTDLSLPEIQRITADVGCVITGATSDLAPADRKLYALRDVTATVSSIPLITASIMSKKLAEGLTALVLDIKYGSGAFMKSLDDARQLARSLVDVGTEMGVDTRALITDMNQPLGRMVGNALEVDEAVATLEGHGPEDLVVLTLELGSELLEQTGRAADRALATQRLREKLVSGEALDRFRAMVSAQGGDLDAPRRRADRTEIRARAPGYVASINGQQLGQIVIELGGGRKQTTDSIDHSVGLEMAVRIGDRVEVDQPLAWLYAPPAAARAAAPQLEAAIGLGPQPPPTPRLIVERIAPSAGRAPEEP